MVAVINEDVFFSDDDKEANLVELWAQNQCLYETTSEKYKDRSKRSQAYQSVVIRISVKKRRKNPNSRLRCIQVLAQTCRCPVALRLRLLRKISRITTCLLLRYAAIMNNLLVTRAHRF